MSNNLPCLGWRYNFKKGTEYCPNADKCNTHKTLSDMPENSDYYFAEVKSFKSIKDFRKCKEYLIKSATEG